MYVPKHFAEKRVGALHDIIESHNFGMLVGQLDGAPIASHLPFLIDRKRGRKGTLLAHMARENPHWRAFATGGEALAVFHGPHAYISASWYEDEENVVPTWNYIAVHAYGVPRVIDQPKAVRGLLQRLVDFQEADYLAPWRVDSQPEAFIESMIGGIVAFEIPVARLEGKVKMSQNRSVVDRQRVIDVLESREDPDDATVAKVMRRYL